MEISSKYHGEAQVQLFNRFDTIRLMVEEDHVKQGRTNKVNSTTFAQKKFPAHLMRHSQDKQIKGLPKVKKVMMGVQIH